MKHRKTALLSALTAAVFLTGTAAAAYVWTTMDVENLQTALLTTGEGAPADYDVDGDGITDVYDLGHMKQSLLSDTGETVTADIPVTASAVKVQGRYVEKNDALWLVQSGSAAEAVVTAEAASVTLAGSSGIQNGEDWRPRYGIYVDGELIADTVMGEKEQTVTLWEGKGSRTAQVKIMLLSEAMYGGVGVRSLTVTSSAAAPVKPAAKNPLSIEFIGDSITCAYGVEGASQGDQFKTSTENFSKSYACLTAQQLGADYAACCYSGHGIVSGYTAEGEKNAESLIPDCYEKASKYADYGEEWDFASARQRDAVVINLGTNDINYVAADPDTRNEEFVEGYKAFLTTVREKNPKAVIVCTVGTMGGTEEIYPLIEQAVAEFGDEKVSCYCSKTHSMADGMGADWHPSEKTQQNSAYVLADKLANALGLESDQIGLDVAAEAEHTVTNANGANSADYFGYGQFWINMVSGGSNASDVEALVSPVEMRKDGVYVLTFDYTTGVDKEIPVLVRSADGTVLFEDTVSSTSDRQSYSQEFTSPGADKNAQIVFQLGGTDSYNATLYDVKLTKIG